MVETVRVVEARGRVVRLFGSGDSLFRKAALRDRCDRHFLHSDHDPCRGKGNGVRDFANARKAASGAVKCTGIQKAGSLSLFFALVFVDYALGIFVCYRMAAEDHAVQTATMSVCAGLAAACLIASTICLIIMHKRRKVK